jgi:AraC-like DNA-binding protein
LHSGLDRVFQFALVDWSQGSGVRISSLNAPDWAGVTLEIAGNPLPVSCYDRGWQRARQRRVLGGYVSLGLVKGIPGVLRELGVDPQPLLAEVGLSEKLLEGENNRISLRALGTLLRISADEAGCPHFGLLLGSKISLAHLGAFASPLQSCDTLGAALRLVETRLGWDRGALFRFDQDGDSAVLTFLPYDPDADGLGLVAEAAMAAITAVLRNLFGAAWEPSEVYLPRRVPQDCRPYSAFFRAPVRFNQEVAGFAIAMRDLNRLSQKADATAETAKTDSLPATERFSDVVEELRRRLRVEMITDKLSSALAAAHLSVHRRTLNRYLSAQGQGFRTVADEVRFSVARQLLSDTDIPLAQVSAALSFSEPAAFTRAFARWSGLSPSRFRAKQKGL